MDQEGKEWWEMTDYIMKLEGHSPDFTLRREAMKSFEWRSDVV